MSSFNLVVSDMSTFTSDAMKSILLVSGSTRVNSANGSLLKGSQRLAPQYAFETFNDVSKLPLFMAGNDSLQSNDIVGDWREKVKASDALIISTPSYLFNIPAMLKNALEWLTTTGELDGKRVLAITFTPHIPRGEKAMQSLIWSLKGLNANVVAQLALYQNEVNFDADGQIIDLESKEILTEAINLLIN